MELIANLTKAEDSILDTIKSVQEPVVGYVRQAVEFIDARLPELPELPFAETLPQPVALVDNGFGFAKDLLDVNYQFAKALVAAVTPLLPTAEQAPARKPAPKTVKVAA